MKKNENIDSKTENLKNRALESFKACKLDMETLQASRAQSLKYYMSDKLGNEIKGRSQLRTTDLADVIEWIMPVLMKIFYGGQDVVTIRPQGPEDELKVKLMEGIVNFDLQKNNNGYKIFYQFFKDALLFKMGVVKYAWEKKVEYKHNDVEFDEAAFQALKSNPDYIIDEVEIIQESVIDASGMVAIPAEYRVVFRKKEKISKSVFWNIPPEEFIFDMTMKSVDDVEGFICHRRLISRDHAKAVYNFTDEDIDAEMASFLSDDVIIQQRFKDLGGINFLTPSKDNSTVKIYVNECYLYEFGEEGNAIPKILTIIGDRVVRVEDNKYGKPPFCVLSPILMSHRMIGRAFEGVEDIQLARTALLRAIMDNIYYTDNQVRVVNPNRINYADYKSGRIPGGTILTKGDIDPSTAIYNLPSTPLPASVFKMFETMLPELRADETGVTKYNQGMDSKSLNKMLDINTLVPMADGSVKKLKYIIDGDRIIGSGDKATTVITAHPIQYPKKAYEMMFANGDVIIAGGEHLWTIRASVDRKKEWEIIDTDTIYEKFSKNKKIYVPLIGRPGFECNEEIPIDPYILGIWLGDGHSYGARFTVSDEGIMDYLISWANNNDSHIYTDKQQKCGKARSVSVVSNKKNQINALGQFKANGSLLSQLRQLSLIKDKAKDKGKCIPEVYFKASYSNRLKLLRGLMDTDGCHHSYSLVIFTQKEGRLLKDVIRLIRSLGGIPRIHELKNLKWAKKDARYHQVSFSLRDNPFAYSVKANKWTKRKHGAEAQRIVSMKEVTIRPMRCLTVDAPDGLFAVGEYFTLTHNTATGINQIMSAAQQRVELIARTFAETGVKDLVQADIDMNIRFFDTERNLKIDNDWKLVTPDMIDGNYDAIIDVGIGTGSKEIQFNQVSMMFDKYAGIANVVKDPILIQEIFWLPQIKEMTKELWKFLGYKSPDRFLSPDKKLTQGDNGGGRRQENNRIPNSDGDRIPMVTRPSEYAEVS